MYLKLSRLHPKTTDIHKEFVLPDCWDCDFVRKSHKILNLDFYNRVSKVTMSKQEYIDTSIVETVTTPFHTLHRKEFKDATGPIFDFEIVATVGDNNHTVDTTETEIKTSFLQNLKYWNLQNRFQHSNDFRSSYYRNIVNMGVEAVPYIVEELKKRPSFLVHALDEILPGVVEYSDGYIPVEQACEQWISILATIEKN